MIDEVDFDFELPTPEPVYPGSQLEWRHTAKGGLMCEVAGVRTVIFPKGSNWQYVSFEEGPHWSELFISKEAAAAAFENFCDLDGE